jgi:hypothetical protein
MPLATSDDLPFSPFLRRDTDFPHRAAAALDAAASTPEAHEKRAPVEPCACLLLAAAAGAGAEAVSLGYCMNVLKKHWQLQCDSEDRCAAILSPSSRRRRHEAVTPAR